MGDAVSRRRSDPIPDMVGLSFVGGFISFLISESFDLNHPILCFILGACITFFGITALFLTKGKDEQEEDL